MKRKIFYIGTFFALLAASGCSKKFLEDMKSYNQYGEETVFANETLTGWYIDRMYNYYFVNYRSPVQTVVAQYSDSRERMTEEMGGTVGDYINSQKTLSLASEADPYYGVALSSNIPNPVPPYTRIQYANTLIEKIDVLGQNLSPDFRRAAKGQMYFLRALQYFDLVRIYGGVPIVTTVENASTDESIKHPRATSSECFALIEKDLDSAAAMLPMKWDGSAAATNYGRLTAAGALAMKSRVLLTAASPLFNTDWDNPGNAKWQKALDAGLDAETKLTAAGYGLYGSNAKDWSEMTFKQGNATLNPEALMVFLFSTTSTSSAGYNNGWENSLRPVDYGGSGNGISAPTDMLNLFPLANGARPTKENGYVDTFFFANRDPRFYRTFVFSGEKWGIKNKPTKSTWFYRWKQLKANPSSASGFDTTTQYYGGNQTNSPALVYKMSNPAADSTGYQYSSTSIFEYRYAELLLNIAECYAAKGDVANAITYLGKIRARVGIPSANNYGIGNLSDRYAAIEACLYERRVELAYEGKRFWDMQRWMLFDNIPASGNSVQKLGLKPINGTVRDGYYWQTKYAATKDTLSSLDRNVLVDPDASPADFNAQIEKLKDVYRTWFVKQPLDKAWDQVNNVPVTIKFQPNYYLSGLPSAVLSNNAWLEQTIGWKDYSGGAGTYNYQQ